MEKYERSQTRNLLSHATTFRVGLRVLLAPRRPSLGKNVNGDCAIELLHPGLRGTSDGCRRFKYRAGGKSIDGRIWWNLIVVFYIYMWVP